MFDEYTTRGGRLVERQTASNLRRWDKPVRFGVRFGESISEAQQIKDRKAITSYAARLGARHAASACRSPTAPMPIFRCWS